LHPAGVKYVKVEEEEEEEEEEPGEAVTEREKSTMRCFTVWITM